MMRKRSLLLFFLLALVLRLSVVLFAIHLPIGLDDVFQYDMLARSIASGNGYRWYAQEDLALIRQYVEIEVPPECDPRGIPTSFRPPLYPAFLALIYAVVGTGPYRFLAARLAQALVGALLVPLTVLLGRHMGLSERPIRLAAVVIAIYPLLVLYPLALATENLYIPLLTLSLTMVLKAGARGRVREYAVAGLFLGLTALTRSVITLFVPLAALWGWLNHVPRRKGLVNSAAMVLAFLAATLPWSVRNTFLHGEFHFVESALGYQLYIGYHPQGTGTFSADFALDLVPIMDDGERHRKGLEAFWSFVRADPARVPYLMVRKLGYFWGLDKRAFQYFYSNGYLGRWPGVLVAGALVGLCGPFVLIAPAGLAGLALSRPRREMVLTFWLIAYSTGIHMLILAEDRFHVPLVPLLVILAAHFLMDRPWRQAGRGQKILAILLSAMLVVNWGWELARDWEVLWALVGPEGHRLGLSY